jgi:hypothetical protein
VTTAPPKGDVRSKREIDVESMSKAVTSFDGVVKFFDIAKRGMLWYLLGKSHERGADALG